MKGKRDTGRQLDALAYVIIGDVKKGAKELGLTKPGIYFLARAAIKRLSRGVES